MPYYPFLHHAATYFVTTACIIELRMAVHCIKMSLVEEYARMNNDHSVTSFNRLRQSAYLLAPDNKSYMLLNPEVKDPLTLCYFIYHHHKRIAMLLCLHEESLISLDEAEPVGYVEDDYIAKEHMIS